MPKSLRRGTLSILHALLWLAAAPGLLRSADTSLPLTGKLLGSVVDLNGIPQMGATVQLFDRFDELVSRTTTSGEGRFSFAGLPIDLYSVRVSLPAFLPATRDRIAVKAGGESLLRIHLATILSSVEVTYNVPTGGMTDDWKWALRTSPATRPVTRLLSPEDEVSASPEAVRPRIFSGTHAMFSLSGGDAPIIDTEGLQGDLGTAFVLSTSVLGKNQVQVGGTLGQNTMVGPSVMALCAIYSRADDGLLFTSTPEVTMTVSQVGIANGNQNFASGTSLTGSTPVRTISLSTYQTANLTDKAHLEYGMTSESVDFVQHSMRISPYARLTSDLGRVGKILAAYSDGDRPDELAAHSGVPVSEETSSEDFSAAVGSLARLPQMSYRNGRLELQRSQNFEVGYQKTDGDRTYAVSAFSEYVSNGRINVAGDTSDIGADNLLSDGVSKTFLYNVGSYRRNGIVASVNQGVGKWLELSGTYGRMGGFTAADAGGSSSLGSTPFLAETAHDVVNVGARAKSRKTGTRISTNYGWMNNGAAIPRHYFTTQNAVIAPGLNILIRQPLPQLFGMPGHLELTADLRNLLAQGYLPVNTGDGHMLLVVQAPRAVRGGLSFVF
jgi:hypothetical protein